MSPRRLPAFAAFCRSTGFATVAQEHRAVVAKGVGIVDLRQPAQALVVPALSEWRISVSVAPSGQLRRQVGDRWHVGEKPPGALSLTPPALELPVEMAAPHHLRVASFESGRIGSLLVAAGAPDAGVLDPLVDRLAFEDPAIAALIDQLWHEAATPGPVAALLTDGVLAMLAARLLRAAGFEPPPPHVGIAPVRLRRALDYIEAHLAEDIGLAEIAAAAGVSAFHFARCFRRCTGQPPYRYLTARRIAHAMRLLQDSGESLAQVALASGFGSQAQFSVAFRAAVGESPGRWRALRQR
jgi:AraC-like DNA-binding protein